MFKSPHLVALALVAAPFIATGSATSPVTDVELFHREQGGFAVYRIPGIVVTAKGSVLAYAEARKSEHGDWGEERIMLRRSTDRGKTWSPAAVVGELPGPFPKNPVAVAKHLGDGEGTTYDNAVAIADANGSIHFLFCVEYMHAYYMRSDDDGRTFSRPREITSAFDAFRRDYAWKVLATGPGHGIQLKNGRLVVPVWLSLGTGGGAHRPSVTSTIYSDDHGATWHRGDIAVPDTPEWAFPNETAAAQLDDGRVVLNVRTESKENRRLITYSPDGATHWTRPVFDSHLLEPVCFGSIIKLPGRRLIFVNPDNLNRADGKETPGGGRDRRNLTVQYSPDDGKTWTAKKVLEPGPASYADLAAFPDGTILCFYEKGAPDAKGFKAESMIVARFPVKWLAEK